MRVSNPGASIEVRQSDPDLLQVQVGHDNDDPYFIALPHGVNTIVWDPAAGASIHLKSLIVSVEAAGMVQIFRDATEWCRMHFNEKKAVPIALVSELTLAADEVLRALYTDDAATADAYITALGHEHL